MTVPLCGVNIVRLGRSRQRSITQWSMKKPYIREAGTTPRGIRVPRVGDRQDKEQRAEEIDMPVQRREEFRAALS